MRKHIKKIPIILVVMVLAAAFGMVFTQAWFFDTPAVENTTDIMGTVEVAVTNASNGSFTLVNNSDIPTACRIGLIPQWIEADNEGLHTIADVSTMTISSSTTGWKAVEDENGKWFLVYEGGTLVKGYGTLAPDTTPIVVSYTIDWNAADTGKLKIEPIAESIQATRKAVTYANWSNLITQP